MQFFMTPTVTWGECTVLDRVMYTLWLVTKLSKTACCWPMSQVKVIGPAWKFSMNKCSLNYHSISITETKPDIFVSRNQKSSFSIVLSISTSIIIKTEPSGNCSLIQLESHWTRVCCWQRAQSRIHRSYHWRATKTEMFSHWSTVSWITTKISRLTMTKTDEENSSGYYSDNALRNANEVDLVNLSNSNLEKIIFEDNNEERPPFKLDCCSDHAVDRSLCIVLTHYIFLFIVVTFSSTFLTNCDANNKFASGVSALLPACLGNVLPRPKKWRND